MMIKRFASVLSAVLLVSAASAAEPVEWNNIDEANHLAGRVASSGYLRGKIVMIDCRDYGKKSCVEPALKLQEIWATFKTKPFVLIGSHRGEAGREKIERISEGLGLTYPIYRGAALAADAPVSDEDGFIYVVDFTGRVIYSGLDSHTAVGVAASAIMLMNAPQSVVHWKKVINFDLDVLPGRAYLELEGFRAAFPEEFKQYEGYYNDLKEDKTVVRLAKLEELARQAKDHDANDRRAKKLKLEKLEGAIEKFSVLKNCDDPVCAQEAKNCIADITWAAATLK